MTFAVNETGRLRFSRGEVRCAVALERVISANNDEVSDDVEARLEVSDATGRRFLLNRRIPGHEFLYLVPTGKPEYLLGEIEQELSAMLWVDTRRYFPAVGADGSRLVGFSYYAKRLKLRMDLLVTRALHRGDGLIIRVHPTEYLGIGSEPTPLVQVRTRLTAVPFLMPSLFALEFDSDPPEVLQFQHIEGEADPDPLVTYLP